jgi:hypothetical protein
LNYGNADAFGLTQGVAPSTVQDLNSPSTDNLLLSHNIENLLAVSYVLNLPFSKAESFLPNSHGLVPLDHLEHRF